MEKLKSEKWLPIKGYEGIYEISDLGRVRSLPRYFTQGHYAGGKAIHFTEGRMMKPNAYPNGYMYVTLTKKGKQKKRNIHRLVAEHFIPKEEGKDIVNHIDCDIKNNKADNLEWCTQKHNIQYAYDIGRKIPPHQKKVSQYSLSGEFIKEWDSLAEAGRSTGTYGANIYKVCRGKREQAGGYKWRYTE